MILVALGQLGLEEKLWTGKESRSSSRSNKGRSDPNQVKLSRENQKTIFMTLTFDPVPLKVIGLGLHTGNLSMMFRNSRAGITQVIACRP